MFFYFVMFTGYRVVSNGYAPCNDLSNNHIFLLYIYEGWFDNFDMFLPFNKITTYLGRKIRKKQQVKQIYTEIKHLRRRPFLLFIVQGSTWNWNCILFIEGIRLIKSNLLNPVQYLCLLKPVSLLFMFILTIFTAQ